ncbi:MAG: hypothetical protein AAF762_11480, partial [Pseudomonadota bacterium]
APTASPAARVRTLISRASVRCRRRHSAQGYALVEVLAAMGIVVLVGTLAFLAFGNQDARRVEAEAAEVALLLQEARMRALEAGRPIEIVVSSRERVLDAGGQQLAFSSGVDVSPENVEIILGPSGSSEGLALRLARGGASKTVTLDWLTGRVLVQ